MRKKREIEAGGREEKSPRMEEHSPGVKEVIDMMNDDTAAEFQHILNDLREEKEERKQKRDEMKKSGGLGAPGPVIANQPNPPLANKMQKMPQQKVQTDDTTVWLENQIQFGATVGGRVTEISLANGGEFDVTFTKDAMMILRSPGATENSEAPQLSKKPKEDVGPQEKTLLRQSS